MISAMICNALCDILINGWPPYDPLMAFEIPRANTASNSATSSALAPETLRRQAAKSVSPSASDAAPRRVMAESEFGWPLFGAAVLYLSEFPEDLVQTCASTNLWLAVKSWVRKLCAVRVHDANHFIKHWLFKNYALVSGIAFVAAIVLFFSGKLPSMTWQVLVAIEGGILSFTFAAQKQQLEEVRLFRELFREFNERYDNLNEDMNRIYGEAPAVPLRPDEVNTLFGYFNLCGEEYLYFVRGFIYPEVWKSWENGMKYFRRNPRIKKLWDDDLKTDAYYGLSFDQKDHDGTTS
jgi:hypothetical protein